MNMHRYIRVHAYIIIHEAHWMGRNKFVNEILLVAFHVWTLEHQFIHVDNTHYWLVHQLLTLFTTPTIEPIDRFDGKGAIDRLSKLTVGSNPVKISTHTLLVTGMHWHWCCFWNPTLSIVQPSPPYHRIQSSGRTQGRGGGGGVFHNPIASSFLSANKIPPPRGEGILFLIIATPRARASL